MEQRFTRLEESVGKLQTHIEGLVTEPATHRQDSNRLVEELRNKFAAQETELIEMRSVQLRILTQRVLSGGESGSAVDTRALGKPNNFDGSSGSWVPSWVLMKVKSRLTKR